MRPISRFQTPFLLLTLLALGVVSCIKTAGSRHTALPLTLQEDPPTARLRADTIRAKANIKIADGLRLTLWASDSLAPDPVGMSIDDQGRVYLTSTNRGDNSEFDIRGHRDWMTQSIGFQSVEDRRAFLHQTFSPERSKENEWLKDLNHDGIHDWHDLTVERDEVWRLEDTNNDGVADKAVQVLNDFFEEISDVAGGVLVRAKDAFVSIAPDMWRLTDSDGNGTWDQKTSISHGYGVHIGFGGHGMSNPIEGPDGKIYWNIGDIGANITTAEGKNFKRPNEGIIARANPDGSDFEVFAGGMRNTHEFVFDDYGNLISSDNDGDHPGESERLVHVVDGADAGWRSNWQYGKYTDPKNNSYKVWMDEKLFKPRWDGQAAYIIPPIMNYHNGPTGMVYNPGTALGSVWKNKFFLVEFVGNPARSPIWAFGLKPQGASFVLDGEQNIVSGILPTGIRFGPDGALYAADWVNGWNVKNYGRVWKLDVTPDKNDLADLRAETKRLMLLPYPTQTVAVLGGLLLNPDQRIRQKAQFELAARGAVGATELQKAISQTTNQLARIHGVWGMGQLARQDKKYATPLLPLLTDADPEIRAQTAKVLGDAAIAEAGALLLPLLTHADPRVKFFGAQALGRIAYQPAVAPLLAMLQANHNEDVYLRHAGVLALSRIGQVEPIVALATNPDPALRLAGVLVLRRLKNENVKLFLKDSDEYIVAEAARAINDDESMPAALPALAATLGEPRFTSEPLLRRAINACLRVGGDEQIDLLIAFANRVEVSKNLRVEALATLGSWGSPSVMDRVDGRYRGLLVRDPAPVRQKLQPYLAQLLQATDKDVVVATTKVLGSLGISDVNTLLVNRLSESLSPTERAAVLTALAQLKYPNMEPLIKQGMNDADADVRTTALGLVRGLTLSAETVSAMSASIFSKGSLSEQQQLLRVLATMPIVNTKRIFTNLIDQLAKKTLAPGLTLDLAEAIDSTKSADLLVKIKPFRSLGMTVTDYQDALFGGNALAGRQYFNTNPAGECVRCHAINRHGGEVGPSLTEIGSTLTREQLLQALIEPSARLSPGYGTVSLTLKGGQSVTGVLMQETDSELVLKTSEAEPLKIPKSRVAKRENLPSSMPQMGYLMSKREIRDMVEFLTTLTKK